MVLSSWPVDGKSPGGTWTRQWGLGAVAGILLAAEMVRAPTVHLDLAPLYGAALLAREGRLDEAYAVDPEVGKRAGSALTEAVHARAYPLRDCRRYLHPPALAALTLPLTTADFPVAAYLFRSLSLGALVASALGLSRLAGAGRGGGAIAVVILLAFDPVRMTLDLGQTNLFVMALLCAGVLVRPALPAGIAIGLACLFKTFAMAVPLAWLVLGGEWRRRAVFAFLTLAIAHATAYLAWPEATFSYLDMMRALSGQQFLWPEQQSLAALATRIDTGFSAQDVSGWVEKVAPAGVGAALAPAFAAAVMVGAAAWARWRRLDGCAAASLALPAGLLASPVLHSHYGTVLAISAAWLVRHAKASPAGWLGLAGLTLQAMPLHAEEARAWLPLFEDAGAHWVFVTYRLVGVALVFAAVVWATRAGSRRAIEG